MYETVDDTKDITEQDDTDTSVVEVPSEKQKRPNEFAEVLDSAAELPPKEPVLPNYGYSKPKKAPELPIIERRNWLLHHHFLRQEWDACKALTKEQLDETHGSCEYASYIKGLVFRQEGKIQESFDMFQACAMMNPKNASYLKQIARSLFLLGKSKTAVDVFNEAAKLTPDDWVKHTVKCFHWELLQSEYYRKYSIGKAYLSTATFKAKESLRQAVTLSKHEESFILLAEIFTDENDVMNAIECYKRAVELSPENPEYLTALGLLYLKTESQQQAFEALGRALGFDPSHAGAILAAGSMMQQHGDYDVALTKYRVAAQQWPDNPQLWNNIGMCFYGKKKFVAAISCLKRAIYLAPFDWKILYNLGMVHLEMQQNASAFHFLSAAININPKVALLYMTLAVVLTNLEDFPNAKQAYELALKLDQRDPVIPFNYAVFLFKQNDIDKAKPMIDNYNFRLQNYKESRSSTKLPREVIEMAERLGEALRIEPKHAPEDSLLSSAHAEKTNHLSDSPERNKPEEEENEKNAVAV